MRVQGGWSKEAATKPLFLDRRLKSEEVRLLGGWQTNGILTHPVREPAGSALTGLQLSGTQTNTRGCFL
jgi:hypothetical protein